MQNDVIGQFVNEIVQAISESSSDKKIRNEITYDYYSLHVILNYTTKKVQFVLVESVANFIN